MVSSKSPRVVCARTSSLVSGRPAGWVTYRPSLSGFRRILQVGLKLRQYPLVKVSARLGPRNRMCLSRVDLVVVWQVGVDQLLNELDRIRQVHVVIPGALDEQQMPLQIFSRIHDRLIAIRI